MIRVDQGISDPGAVTANDKAAAAGNTTEPRPTLWLYHETTVAGGVILVASIRG